MLNSDIFIVNHKSYFDFISKIYGIWFWSYDFLDLPVDSSGPFFYLIGV
jgi:hypothetical protein